MSGGAHKIKYISRDLALKYEKRGEKFTFSLKLADSLKVPQKDFYMRLLLSFRANFDELLCFISVIFQIEICFKYQAKIDFTY